MAMPTVFTVCCWFGGTNFIFTFCFTMRLLLLCQQFSLCALYYLPLTPDLRFIYRGTDCLVLKNSPVGWTGVITCLPTFAPDFGTDSVSETLCFPSTK
jgi:hypothetical protein